MRNPEFKPQSCQKRKKSVKDKEEIQQVNEKLSEMERTGKLIQTQPWTHNKTLEKFEQSSNTGNTVSN
jgi:hypothetical protein